TVRVAGLGAAQARARQKHSVPDARRHAGAATSRALDPATTLLEAAGASMTPSIRNRVLLSGASLRSAQASNANCASWLRNSDQPTDSRAKGRTRSRYSGG